MSEQTLTLPTTPAAPQRRSTVDLSPVRRGKVAEAMVDSVVLAWRSLLRIPRQLDWLMGVTIMPIMFLLMFRYIFGGTLQAAMPPGISAVNYLVVGIIVQGIVFGGMNTALGLATDAKEGLMDRFMSLPMSRFSVVMGRILADLAISVFTTTITIVVGLLVGFRPTASVGDWALAILLLLLTAFTFSWIGAAVGLWLKTIEAVNSIGFSLIMPLTFVSTAFTQTEFLPSWLQGFARHQPFSVIVDAMRGLLTGYPEVGNNGWIALAWLGGVLVVFMPLTVWLFERRAKA
ncbi:MAG TPA: ABC transporter permease [Thermomicrobiales bacterium]|nr:ABC transporter permease [Thermomicrobiales bacterium]